MRRKAFFKWTVFLFFAVVVYYEGITFFNHFVNHKVTHGKSITKAYYFWCFCDDPKDYLFATHSKESLNPLVKTENGLSESHDVVAHYIKNYLAEDSSKAEDHLLLHGYMAKFPNRDLTLEKDRTNFIITAISNVDGTNHKEIDEILLALKND